MDVFGVVGVVVAGLGLLYIAALVGVLVLVTLNERVYQLEEIDNEEEDSDNRRSSDVA